MFLRPATSASHWWSCIISGAIPDFLNLDLHFKRLPGYSYAPWYLRGKKHTKKLSYVTSHFFLLWLCFLSHPPYSVPTNSDLLVMRTLYFLCCTEQSLWVQQSLRNWILPITTMSGFRNILSMSHALGWLHLSLNPNFSFISYTESELQLNWA